MSATSKQVMLAIVFSFVSLSSVPSAAQTTPRMRWKDLEREIRSALDKGGFPCPDELRFGPSPVEIADITGDGIPETLVEYCHMGASTSDFVLMQLEDGKPITARFRDRHGKKIQVEF